MSEQYGKVRQTQNFPIELSVKDLEDQKARPHKKKKLLQVQKSKPPKNSVKIKATPIPVHFKWALILTMTCFFVIGPVWALYKTREIRRLIARKEYETATRLSTKISAVLVLSTIIGCFAWVSFLFCSVGLLLTGELLKNHFI